MKAEITAPIIYNEVRMLRTVHDGTIIIFESENDIRNFIKFFDDNCECIPAFGKKNATGALKMIDRDNIEGVLTIVDNDYWFLESFKIDSPNMLVTDSHDSETMILQSGALDNLLLELADESKLQKFVSKEAKGIREILLEKGKYIGYFRWFLSKYKIRAFILRDLKFQRFINSNSLIIDIDKLIWEALKKNLKVIHIPDNFKTFKKYVLIVLNDLDKKGYDLWHICAGHDLIKILIIGLKFIFGNKTGKNIYQRLLEITMRLSYAINHFQTTKLYKSIKVWEEKNFHFTVLIKEQ